MKSDSDSAADGWLLGVDIGTSSVKALAIALDGSTVAEASVETPMHRPRPGWAENDPEDWIRGIATAVRRLLGPSGARGDAVLGMAIVSQRDPWVLLDQTMRPLAPSISWTDRRSEPFLAAFYERLERSWLIDHTGVLPIPGLGLPNLLWWQQRRPERWAQVRHLMSPKDYVLHRLAGIEGTDVSTPTRSVMNDIRNDCWSAEICTAANIPLEMLPDVRWRPWERVGELPPEAAEMLGLRPGIPLAAGGGDDQAATLGAGAVAEGDLCAGTGTSSDWRMVTRRCEPDSVLARGDLAQHVVPDLYVFEVCIESTGSSMRWFRESFGDGTGYTELIEQARAVPPGADGLMFMPFVDGCNRAPWFIEGATGGFLGIVSGHTRAHFVRAILEGIAYQYPPTFELISPGGADGRPVTLVDGEARSALWNQLKADVMGVPVRTTEVSESAALGATVLAGQAAGLFGSAADAARQLVRFARTYEPEGEQHAQYAELRAEHQAVFEAVRPTYGSGTGADREPLSLSSDKAQTGGIA